MSGVQTGTYVYCLIAAGRVPALNLVRKGLPGMGPVRLLPVAEPDEANGQRRLRPRTRRGPLLRWLAVSDAPLRLYGEDAINRRLSDVDWVSRAAIAHEAVVESFIDQPAVLPMKLFTIFMNDHRALEHVHTERSRIAVALDRVVGHHEYGVRVMLDAMAVNAQRTRKRGGKREAVTSGAAYLSLKKAQRDQATELVERARDIVAELYERFEGHASESKRRGASELPVGGGPLLLDAAFLVPRARLKRFIAAVARETKALALQGYRVNISGPWPPYSFM